MSEELQSTESPSRRLYAQEVEIIRALADGLFPTSKLEAVLKDSRVVDLRDGGMGSIRFVSDTPRSFGATLVEAQYVDSDGVLVSIAVNGDKDGRLLELDFWKVDFSPLRRYPSPSDVSQRRILR